MWTSMAARTSPLAPPPPPPGRRTGAALIVSGRTGNAVSDTVTASSASRPVDLGLGAATKKNAPLVGQLLVRAVRDQVLDGLLDRVPQLVLVLGDRDAVRRGVVGLAGHLELAGRLLGGVLGDGRVGEHGLGAAVAEREVGGVLVVEGDPHRGGLAALLALVHASAGVGRGARLGGQLVLLRGALLDRDLLAAQRQVVRRELQRVAGLAHQAGAGREVGHEVKALLPLLVVGEGGEAVVVLLVLLCRLVVVVLFVLVV